MKESIQEQNIYRQPFDPALYPWHLPRQTWRIVGRKSINLILFLATLFSTWLVGGPWFSLAIMSILGAHEMGHFLMCRKYQVPATLPYFIPFPFPSYNPFGTLGALISMRGFFPNRKALFDIGAGGPLAGLAVTLPVLAIGLALSTVTPLNQETVHGLTLGECLLFKALSWLILGYNTNQMQVVLHPVAYAGWAGLFVTGLNLIPVGQLDGGHVMYALFGQRVKYITWGLIAALGILTYFNYSWALFFILLVIFGRRHPAPLDAWTPLDPCRRFLGYLFFLLFIITFTPFPFQP